MAEIWRPDGVSVVLLQGATNTVDLSGCEQGRVWFEEDLREEMGMPTPEELALIEEEKAEALLQSQRAEAATVLQGGVRGQETREQLEGMIQSDSAERLQAYVRGNEARADVDQAQKAATIQAGMRGRQERDAVARKLEQQELREQRRQDREVFGTGSCIAC